VYDKVARLTPPELKTRLAPAEIFHEVLEHRWFLSEKAGRDVGTTAAARSYFENVLPRVPEPMVLATAGEEGPRFGEDTGSWFLFEQPAGEASPPAPRPVKPSGPGEPGRRTVPPA
jgi:hypothetical protein